MQCDTEVMHSVVTETLYLALPKPSSKIHGPMQILSQSKQPREEPNKMPALPPPESRKMASGHATAIHAAKKAKPGKSRAGSER